MSERKVGLVGSGSWATALAKMLCMNHSKMKWWVRDEYVKGALLKTGRNPGYLSSVQFDPEKLELTTDINELMEDSDWLILAVPSIHLESCLEPLREKKISKFTVSAIKGIVPGHFKIVGEYLHEQYDLPYDNFGVISGPCHAEEVAMGRLSYLTISAQQREKAELTARALASDFIKTTVSNDIFGTEYAAVLKNIYAIAAGIAHGLGYGDNFQAVLMSNAAQGIKWITQHISPIERDVTESAYLGDLLVTGYSKFSRNRSFGNMIGKGYTVKSAILEMNMVAEGYYAAKSVYEAVQNFEADAPIICTVYKILYEGVSPREAFEELANKMS